MSDHELWMVGGVVFEPGVADPATGRWMPPPEQAAQWLGRKGLLGKNWATRMALCAVHWLTQWYADRCGPGPRTGVVVASNFGNHDIVARDAVTLAADGDQGLSPMDAATHSSNIIASSLAIRFGWKGPNLTVCSGPRASTDALMLSRLLLRAGRCDQVVLAGVDDQVPPPHLGPTERNRPLAAALLLELAGDGLTTAHHLTPDPVGPIPLCHGAADLLGPAMALHRVGAERSSDD